MRGGGDNVGIRHGAWVLARGDEPRDVRHVHHEVRAHRVRDLAHFCKVDDAGVRARPGDDELGAALLRFLHHGVVVYPLALAVNAVEAGVEVLAGDGRLRPVGEVSPVAEIHAEYRVARLQKREVHRDVRLRAGVRLHIGMLRVEKAHRPFDCKLLYLVHVLAAAVIACVGIALGVFIRQMAAHRLHNGGADEVFGGDKLNMVPLARKLAHHGIINLSVLLLYNVVAHFMPPFCFLIVFL